MLELLHLENVGPAPLMEMALAPRLNLLTGDNGLGKSFLLDVAWWAMTQKWPRDLNGNLTSGYRRRRRTVWAHLADGFRNLCGYSAMYEPTGTVDHFVSWNEDRSRAYDWSNYRFASGWLNSSKSKLKSTDMLDPHDTDDGWFEILLPSLQMVATDAVPPDKRAVANNMLVRLHLGHDERVLRQRREWYRMYQQGEITLDGLAKKAPLIARAVEKHRRAVAPDAG